MSIEWKRLSSKHKNSKIAYYFKAFMREKAPESYNKLRLKQVLASADKYDPEYLKSRVDYYCKLEDQTINDKFYSIADVKEKSRKDTYYRDFAEVHRFFDDGYKVCRFFGDLTHVPDDPTFVKARPLYHPDNSNSVLMKWDKVRHFILVNDEFKTKEKKDMLVWRGKAHEGQENRKIFLEMYNDHPMCNVGGVTTTSPPEHRKERMTIQEQLKYKFILSLEGCDVATNLKWVMSSNSVAVMPQPMVETWFMEGSLIPDHHYIEIARDFSDVEEKLNYYINHPTELNQIIKNAHEHVAQFRNRELELLLQYMVMEKYLKKTGQL
jgi:hypothetical protein